MRLINWIVVLLLCSNVIKAQVVGGEFAFEFLRLSNAPHISALGGINVANMDRDISFAMQNPSLMRPSLHNELGLNYNSYYAGIGIMNLQYGYHVPEINTSFALGLQYINYGDFTFTNETGNEGYPFTARDFAISLAASRSYGDNWRYGASLKWAQSSLYFGTATAILTDVGISYIDTENLWQIGAVAKNMGLMLKKINPNNPAEALPFDLQLGAVKQFQHMPLRLMATVHHLYEWDIQYNNPSDLQTSVLSSQDTSAESNSSFAEKFFRHFTFAAELNFAKRISLMVSYNVLKRREMIMQESGGLAGFAFGVGINLNKFQVHYARSYYHIAGAYNEIGFSMTLNKLFGIGALGNKIHWSDTYRDWL